MARNKYSTALFEVIHADKRFQKKTTREGALRMPKWWSKGRTGTPAAEAEEAPFVVSPEAASAAPTTPVEAPPAEPEPSPTAPEPADGIDFDAPPQDPTQPKRAGRRSGRKVALDPDRHELTLRVRYNTAIVTGFAVLVAIGLAYVTGRHTGRGPASAYGGPTTEEIRQGPVNADVTEIKTPSRAPTRVPRNSEAPAVSRTTTPGTAVRTPAPVPAPAPAAGSSAVPGAEWVGRPRQIGLNYVVIQSYPSDLRKMADEAVDVLARGGVDASVERGLRGYGSKWVVVGTAGFDSVRTPEFQAYVKKIERISEAAYKASKTSKRSFSAFQPQPGYRWGEMDP